MELINGIQTPKKSISPLPFLGQTSSDWPLENKLLWFENHVWQLRRSRPTRDKTTPNVTWHAHQHLCLFQSGDCVRSFKGDSHIACRAHAIPLPCRAAKRLECVFPIWFTQCGRVWFTLAMPCSDHAVLLKATAQHGRLSTARRCCGLEKNGMVGAWYGKCESDTAALCKTNGKDTF